MIEIIPRHHYRGIPKLKAGHFKLSDLRIGTTDSESVKQRRNKSLRRFYAQDETPKARQARIDRARKVTLSMFNQFDRRPTGPEILMMSLLPKDVRYVGDGKFYVWVPSLGRNRNPDFKVVGMKKVVEVFGDYWHRGEDTRIIEAQYAESGFGCLVVWESELMDDPVSVSEKIGLFLAKEA